MVESEEPDDGDDRDDRWPASPTIDLISQRVAEFVEAGIAAEPDEERRQLLQEFYEDGDYGIQPTGRPGMVLVTIGDEDFGEVTIVSLHRPDNPSLN